MQSRQMKRQQNSPENQFNSLSEKSAPDLLKMLETAPPKVREAVRQELMERLAKLL